MHRLVYLPSIASSICQVRVLGDGMHAALGAHAAALLDLVRAACERYDLQGDALSEEQHSKRLQRRLLQTRALEAQRCELAPYMILSDLAVAAVASKRPSCISRLAAVPGVPLRVAERHGGALLRTVAEYCRACSLPMEEEPPSALPASMGEAGDAAGSIGFAEGFVPKSPAGSSHSTEWRTVKRLQAASDSAKGGAPKQRQRKLPPTLGKK